MYLKYVFFFNLTIFHYICAEGVEELNPNDPEQLRQLKKDLDVEQVIKLIDSVRQKQGNAPGAGSIEETKEREKLYKAAQNLHIWMNTDDPVRPVLLWQMSVIGYLRIIQLSTLTSKIV